MDVSNTPARFKAILLAALSACFGTYISVTSLSFGVSLGASALQSLLLGTLFFIVAGIGLVSGVAGASRYWRGDLQQARPHMNLAVASIAVTQILTEVFPARIDAGNEQGLYAIVAVWSAVMAWNLYRFVSRRTALAAIDPVSGAVATSKAQVVSGPSAFWDWAYVATGALMCLLCVANLVVGT